MNTLDTNSKKRPDQPHYSACTEQGWGVEMLGLEAMDSSAVDHAGILGMSITNFTIEAADISKARVRNKYGKWLPYKTDFGMNKAEALGDGTPITGIEIVGSGFIYSVHVKGGSWLPTVLTSDLETTVMTVASSTIDGIWINKI